VRSGARPALAALLALAGGAVPAFSQAAPPRGEVRGTVRSTLGERVSYAVVALEPGASRRFTDDSGAFAFPNLAPGTYHLRARQVGYKPLDTTVVVTGGRTTQLDVSLERLVVELEEIRVVARAGASRRCTSPGPPDAAVAPELAAVFDQLRQNAERYWLLADSYPAVYRMERRFGRPDRYGRLQVTRIDTTELRTDARWRYAPGRVVTDVPGPRGRSELQVNLPGLPDFADTIFLANHCWRLGGMDTVAHAVYVRVDFRAAERITEPDADGSAYLDPDSYLIRFVKVQLTRPDQAAHGLESMEATVAFREVVPSLVLPDHISSAQEYRAQGILGTAEEQQTVDFRFLHALPATRP
jgi:hypothetical protein